MKISQTKLKAIIRYFGTYTNPKKLGKKKLMKLFYFLDFGHVKRFGFPITYDQYAKWNYGPVPQTIMNMVYEVQDGESSAALADTISVEIGKTHLIKVKNSFVEEDEKIFSKNELQLLKDICERFKDSDGGQVEELAKGESPYKKTSMLFGDINYELAAEDKDCKFNKEVISALAS